MMENLTQRRPVTLVDAQAATDQIFRFCNTNNRQTLKAIAITSYQPQHSVSN